MRLRCGRQGARGISAARTRARRADTSVRFLGEIISWWESCVIAWALRTFRGLRGLRLLYGLFVSWLITLRRIDACKELAIVVHAKRMEHGLIKQLDRAA